MTPNRKGRKSRTEADVRTAFEQLPRDENGCWIRGGATRNGYGIIYFEGRSRYAHRMSWIVFRGPIPKGEGHHGTVVGHRCDNRLCCNPDHLFLGSQGDNLADMWAKGRASTGSQRATFGNARLSPDQVRAIRRMFDESSLSEAKIGAIFGITQTAVSAIGRRKTWSHIE